MLHVDGLVTQNPTCGAGSSTAFRSTAPGTRIRRCEGGLSAAEVERGRLVIQAQISGTVVQLADPISVGEWFKAGEALGLIEERETAPVHAYVMEANLRRIKVGDIGSIITADLASPRLNARVTAIDGAAIETLPGRELASVRGGPVATRQGANSTLVPEVSLYCVTLDVTKSISLQHLMSGFAVIEAQPASIAGEVWRKVAGVIIRESGL